MRRAPLLVVDAAQGVEAQTVANTYLAVEAGLELIPALNKIDLPGAEPERVADEISELLGESTEDIIRMSAKTGEGITEILESIVAKIPSPAGDTEAPARALIFDSEFDQYRGVVAYVRVVDGELVEGRPDRRDADRHRGGDRRDRLLRPDDEARPDAQRGRGRLRHHRHQGRVAAARRRHPDHEGQARPSDPLPGYREVKPMVFCGLFPVDTDRFSDLRDALEKLSLNDAALSYEPETSQALGFGFRCGFLGLLHMDIVRERLEREYDLELLATTPNVEYDVTLTDGTELIVHSPSDMPDPARIEEIREPYIRATILCPKEDVGAVMELCQDRRGTHVDMSFLSEERVQLHYDLPLAEIVLDFFDQLKSRTKGYASLDYELDRHAALEAGQARHPARRRPGRRAVDGRPQGQGLRRRAVAWPSGCASRSRASSSRWRSRPPIGSHIIARESVKAVRKDVIAKCYGGDITRKRKLLEKQKEGQEADEAGRAHRGAAGGVPVGAHARRRRRLRPL